MAPTSACRNNEYTSPFIIAFTKSNEHENNNSARVGFRDLRFEALGNINQLL